MGGRREIVGVARPLKLSEASLRAFKRIRRLLGLLEVLKVIGVLEVLGVLEFLEASCMSELFRVFCSYVHF